MIGVRDKKLKRYIDGDFSFDSFTEGDFRSSSEAMSLKRKTENLAFIGFGGWYLYRGARGAGYFPLNPKFWKSLEVIQEQNIKRFISQEYWKYIGPINKNAAQALTARLKKTGFGLRSGQEAVTSLFSRSISGLSDAASFLGLDKLTATLKKTSEYILGGTPEKLLGFDKLPSSIKSAILKGTAKHAGFSPGARTLGALGKSLGMKVALPILAATAAFKLLDGGARSAGEKGGIPGIFASSWVNFRMMSQKVLSLTGIPQIHRALEEEFPGHLRVAGIAAGAVSGARSVVKSGLVKKLGGGFSGYAGGYLSIIGRAFAGGVLGMALEKFLGKTPKELEDIYSGKEKVPIRKGRWWEFGRTPYEGGKVEYFRPHWYPLMMAEGKKLDTLTPSSLDEMQLKFLKGESLPSRPIPVGTEEWLSSQGGSYGSGTLDIPSDAALRLGIKDVRLRSQEKPAGSFNPKVIASESIYRATEAMGLPGYVTQEMLKRATGSVAMFDTPRIQSGGVFGDVTKGFYDKDLGGMLGANEIFRRYLPSRRREVDIYNPVPNRFSQDYPWLPGENSYLDLKHGDPYSKLKMAGVRLPGPGYEHFNRLHSGVPGEYSPVDAFMVLSDVAPFSQEYKEHRKIVEGMVRKGQLSSEWEDKYREAMTQRHQRTQEYVFYPKTRTTKDTIEKDLSKINKETKDGTSSGFDLSSIPIPGADYFTREREQKYSLLGSAWREGMNTIGSLPVPGVSWIADKILPYRSAIEHYRKFQVYSSSQAEWSHPIRDFVMPYVHGAISMFNEGFVPPRAKKRSDIEEYFDNLEYLKYSMLSSKAKAMGDDELESIFSKKAKSTMAGTGPDASPDDVFWSLPKRERPYFYDFLKAKGGERKRILKFVPGYMKEIYTAQWGKEDRGPSELGKMFPGLELNIGSGSGKSGPTELNQYFSKKHMPGKNWAGWHPSVEMDEIKVKVAKQEGINAHDMGLWDGEEGRSRAANVPTISQFNTPNIKQMNPYVRRMLLEQMLGVGITDPHIDISYVPSDYDGADIDFSLSRDFSHVYANRVGALV